MFKHGPLYAEGFEVNKYTVIIAVGNGCAKYAQKGQVCVHIIFSFVGQIFGKYFLTIRVSIQ